MEASIVDLRYRMKDILKALARHEQVTVLYHGRKRGILKSVGSLPERSRPVHSSPFFGMNKDAPCSVQELMEHLRGGREHDL